MREHWLSRNVGDRGIKHPRFLICGWYRGIRYPRMSICGGVREIKYSRPRDVEVVNESYIYIYK